MATLLIMRGADPRAVELRRVGAWTRLLARTRSWTLDWALAGGASPDSSTALSLRAHVLISATHRRGLARELRGALAAAARPPHPFDPTVRVPHQVLLARDSIEQVAELLEAPEPVDPRGVARLKLLLRDGSGPLYRPTAASQLPDLLEEIIDALAPSPTVHADA